MSLNTISQELATSLSEADPSLRLAQDMLAEIEAEEEEEEQDREHS